MAATAMLAKIAIPLGVGLVLLASRSKASTKGTTLTRRAVRAMQSASAEDLEAVIDDFRSEDDDTTAGALEFQKARMVSRGTPGFTTVPTDTRDGVLKINNQEFSPRLIQLEGRAKALLAWAEAYESIGAKKTAADLRNKAKALDPKADKESDKGSDSAVPQSVVERVANAVATGDPVEMRRVAAELRKEGFKAQADALDKAANEVEEEIRNRTKPPSPTPGPSPTPVPPVPGPTPGPSPSPAPKAKRTVVVKSGDSEARITKRLIGSDTRWPELVAANIPKDADGRSRQKLTANNANGESLNRLGGLKPGLHPGQKLFIPDSWVLLDEVAPKPDPKPAPTPGPSPITDSKLKATLVLINHVAGKTQGQEDSTLVRNWQTVMQRPVDGKYGPGDGIFIADTFSIVPPTPLWWPKSNTQKALTNWKQEMSRKAVELPDKAAGFFFAAENGKQPGFNAPSGSKVVSKLLGVAE